MTSTLNQIAGSTAYDSEGTKLGKVGQIYIDNSTDEPTWVSVNTGLFGMSESLVPMAGSQFTDGDLHVRPTKAKIKDAPHLDAEGGISGDQERALIEHYGLTRRGTGQTDTGQTGTATGSADTGRTDATAAAGQTGTATGTAGVADSGGTGQHRKPTTGDDTIIRSEEQLNVGTQRETTGKARLRKYVVTETQQVNVPVTHEEVRVEREPIGADEAAKLQGNAKIGEASADVDLHAERVVVQKETVPVEKVRLGTEEVTENKTVSEQVRKEEIDTDLKGTDHRK